MIIEGKPSKPTTNFCSRNISQDSGRDDAQSNQLLMIKEDTIDEPTITFDSELIRRPSKILYAPPVTDTSSPENRKQLKRGYTDLVGPERMNAVFGKVFVKMQVKEMKETAMAAADHVAKMTRQAEERKVSALARAEKRRLQLAKVKETQRIRALAGNALKSVKKFMKGSEAGLKIDDLIKKRKRSPNRKRPTVKVNVNVTPNNVPSPRDVVKSEASQQPCPDNMKIGQSGWYQNMKNNMKNN